MDFSGPDAIDKAIETGHDFDGSLIPEEMLRLYKEVMDNMKNDLVWDEDMNKFVKDGQPIKVLTVAELRKSAKAQAEKISRLYPEGE